MPNSIPATQHQLPLQDTVRPSSIYQASLHHFDTPIAVKPKPASRSWLQALLPAFGSARGRVADIQKSMLAELSQVAAQPLHEETLARMIMQAQDAETLWALRHALAQAICSARDEVVAQQKMTEISFMFAGLLRRRHHSHASAPDGPIGENVVRLSPRGQQPGLSA